MRRSSAWSCPHATTTPPPRRSRARAARRPRGTSRRAPRGPRRAAGCRAARSRRRRSPAARACPASTSRRAARTPARARCARGSSRSPRAPGAGVMPLRTASRSAFSAPVSPPSTPAWTLSSEPTRPVTTAAPSSVGMTPAITRSNVDLPDPLSPTSATDSPAAIVRSSPRSPQFSSTWRVTRASAGVSIRFDRPSWKRTPTARSVTTSVMTAAPSRSGAPRRATAASRGPAGRARRRADTEAPTRPGPARAG